MNHESAKQMLVEFQESQFPRAVARDLSVPLDTGRVASITGVRRSGKTYLLLTLAESLVRAGVPKQRLAYISFDDPRLLPATARELAELPDVCRELFPDDRGPRYLFLDEVQQVEDWELGVRRIHDTRRFSLAVTGSSSRMLSGDIATSLRGRSLTFELLPFSARECLRSQGVAIDRLTTHSVRRADVRRVLAAYFTFGGFPEVVLADEDSMRLRILGEYVETMFMRDLVERNRVRNPAAMRELFRFIVTNVANLFSANAFWKWLRSVHPLTKRTLLQYVSHLEDSGLVFLVRKFSHSLKEQNLRPRKAYLVDNGLRTVYGLSPSHDRGRVLENSVYLGLRQHLNHSPLARLNYWQESKGREVDFVVTDGGKVRALIQVASDPTAFGVKERETSALVTALAEFRLKHGLVITSDHSGKERVEGRTIHYVPFWKWVLAEDLLTPA